MTHGLLADVISGKKEFQFCRGKLNGDVFTRTGNELRGCDVLIMSGAAQPDMVERCDGRYYVLYPLNWMTRQISCQVKGSRELIKFESHPLFPCDRKVVESILVDSRYEGLMLWDGKVEYRCKRIPTVETVLDDCAWEVGLVGGSLCKIRPRPGKYSSSSPLSYLRSCVTLTQFVEWMFSSSSLAHRPLVSEVRGSKIVFFRWIDGLLHFGYTRERSEKGWDFVGGKAEGNETAEETLCREVGEEVDLLLKPDDYCYLGPNTNEGYCSHVFIGRWKWADDLRMKWCLVTQDGATLPEDVPKWLPRHLTFLASRLGRPYNVPWFWTMKRLDEDSPNTIPGGSSFDFLDRFTSIDYVESVIMKLGNLTFPLNEEILIFRAREKGYHMSPGVLRGVRSPRLVCGDNKMIYGYHSTSDCFLNNLLMDFLAGIPLIDVEAKRSIYVHIARYIDHFHPKELTKTMTIAESVLIDMIKKLPDGRYFFPSAIARFAGESTRIVTKSMILKALPLSGVRYSIGQASFVILSLKPNG